MTALLELRGLRCERDDRCLFQDLNLTLSGGDIVQIEGPNGAGKTTLLRILTLLSNDYTGEIWWRGQPVHQVEHDYRQQILFLGHLAGIKKALTPRENLNWYAGLHSAGKHSQAQLEQALEAVGLFGYEDMACHSLSAGQMRRVALARLYLTPAKVWILDEPFTAIDKQGVAKLEQLMQKHVAQGGTIILTTHQDLGIAALKRVNLQDFRGVSH